MVELTGSGGDQGQGWKYTFVRARNTHTWTRVRGRNTDVYRWNKSLDNPVLGLAI